MNIRFQEKLTKLKNSSAYAKKFTRVNFKLACKLLADDKEKIADKNIKYGLYALTVFFVIFLFWAIFIPIKSASIAEGIVVLDFSKKTVQHLEGGIIDKILVKEGQMVKSGDVLLYLHDIKAKSEHQIITKRLWTMQLQRERLMAERESRAMNMQKFFEKIGETSSFDEEELNDVIKNQTKLFRARKEKLQGEIKVLQERLAAAEAQKNAAERKLQVYRNEFNAIKPLVEENNLPILRQYDLEKEIAELEGKVAQLKSEAASARLEIANYKNEDLSKNLDEAKETDLEIVNLSHQLETAEDILKRSEIIAPVSGKVMNIKYHTIGAVIPPSGEIMNIVPQNEELIIEAKVKPQDIDNVSAGLKAKVMLTAFKGKKVPKLDGEVINISPDIIMNEQTRESYFLARIRINEKSLEKLKSKIELSPGMPAQVFIINGSRSLLSYLFTPIKDATYRSFREE